MAVDILSLSDEELMNLDPSTLEDGSAATDSADLPEGDAGESQETPAEAQADEGQADADEAADEGGEASDAAGEGQDGEAADGTEGKEKPKTLDWPEGDDVAKKPEAAKTEGEAGKDETKPDAAKPAVNIEAEYQKLLAPFVANGKEMAVKSVDEAITLMQMGANYNKKMAALKPNLKLMKLLESNGLMSEDKIGYLIDLASKNPGAINRLVKESGIDPMDLSTETADAYKPTVRKVDDREMELDSVLEEIQDTPTYQRTLKVVGTEWDAASKQVVANTPELLKVINQHVQSGIYDIITAEVERERTFGRLRGASDIEAYRQVGDAIQARGGFDHLSASGRDQGQQTKAPQVVVQPKPKQVDEEALKAKRRAASPAKPAAAPSKTPKDFNPLSLSDEEFSKLVQPNLL